MVCNRSIDKNHFAFNCVFKTENKTHNQQIVLKILSEESNSHQQNEIFGEHSSATTTFYASNNTSLTNKSTNLLRKSSSRSRFHHPYPLLIPSTQCDGPSGNKPKSINQQQPPQPQFSTSTLTHTLQSMPNHNATIITSTTKQSTQTTSHCNFNKAQSLSPPIHHLYKANGNHIDDAFILARSRSTSLTSKPITANGVHHVMQTTGEDSSQSSLNLSASSGYLSGSSSANSSSAGGSNLNLSVRSSSSLSNGTAATTVANGVHSANGQLIGGNGVLTIQSNGNHPNGDHINTHYHSQVQLNGSHHMQPQTVQSMQPQSVVPQPTNSRRRTISSNSNG